MKITEKLPQEFEPIKSVTLREIVLKLPSLIIYPFNIWIGGKVVRYGRTSDNLIFLAEGEGDPDSEVMDYFNELVEPLGLSATVSFQWKNESYQALRLYNQGHMIIDHETLCYTEIPFPTRKIPMITSEELIEKLPPRIAWEETLYLTGSLVKNGWSCNDVDIITFDPIERGKMALLRKYLTNILGWKTDVGQKVMIEREPVYLFKLYEKGYLCLQ